MKRRNFLKILGIGGAVSVAPRVALPSPTKPLRPYNYYEDGPQSAFGLAPIKREGSKVKYDES